jgi:hypothetical protein
MDVRTPLHACLRRNVRHAIDNRQLLDRDDAVASARQRCAGHHFQALLFIVERKRRSARRLRSTDTE